ncbi:MAG: hypothetical protein J2P24_10685 [Streptosporangiales bacterium]|nr:hypothetical protein [Streptosporangiales bacterium]MBO0890501.1 hypothetical protein [Acidothermales bacterium]
MRGPTAGDEKDAASARRTPYALPWIGVDEPSPTQVAMMQSLDDARRAGLVADDEVRAIEQIIRDGHPHRARKRLTEAKRRNGHRDGPG